MIRITWPVVADEAVGWRALVVDVEGGKGVLAGGVAVAVGERAQLLQPFGHRAREPVLARHVREQDDIARRLQLVAAVRAPQLLHLCIWEA